MNRYAAMFGVEVAEQDLQYRSTAVDGLGMLLHQARPGFEAWFGVAPEVTAKLRAFVLAD